MKRSYFHPLVAAAFCLAIAPHVSAQPQPTVGIDNAYQHIKPKLHPNAELSSDELASIQRIGQAVLQAKRGAVAPVDLAATRAQLTAVQTALEKLNQPVPATRLQVLSASSASANTNPKLLGWQDAHAGDVDSLRRQIRQLRGTQSSVQKLSFAALTQPQSPNLSGEMAGVTPQAKQRITDLEGEINSTLALPEAERQQRLRQLAAEFKLQKSAQQVLSTPDQPETPTLMTLTHHRRDNP